MQTTLKRWLEEEDACSKKLLLSSEKKLGLIRKWALHIGGLSLVTSLYQPDAVFYGLVLFFLAFAGFYSFYVLQLARPRNIRTGWYLSYLEDVILVACLIYFSGGLQSEFALLYPYIMIGVAASRLRVTDVLLTGFLGHASCVVALYFYYGGLSFYFATEFWVWVVFITGSFLLSLVIVERMSRDKDELRWSRDELEQITQELVKSNTRLEALAVTDGLTELYNHRYFQQRLLEEVQRAERYESSLCLAMMDVDYFKHFNDTQGHPRGDEVLVEISRLIRENIRATDLAARYGGEEFAIIFTEMDQVVTDEVAERIRAAVEAYEFFGQESQPGGRLTISIGLACYPNDATSAEELIKKADEALYRAKQRRGNIVVPYYSVLESLKQLEGADRETEVGGTLFEAVEALLMVIDQRDHYTHGHTVRTKGYAETLARKLGLTEEQVRLVQYAAFVHDIGKLKVPKEILNKSRPLTEDELQTVKSHALHGVNIIEPLQHLQQVIPIIKHHHERYDGAGYPDGLKGEEISLEARILALADAFDAMRSARPYRSSLTIQKAVEELRKGAGGQFDPDLVETFVEVIYELEGLGGSQRN